MKLRIGLKLLWQNDGSYANFIGDAQVAEAWAKYLRRRDDVESVSILGPQAMQPSMDVVIHFHHQLPLAPFIPCTNIWYLQNAWPPNHLWPHGTVGVYQDFHKRFDGTIFVSEGLREHCGADGPVIPFGTDPEEMFYEYDEKYAHPVCFVGNDIRGEEANRKYLLPHLAYGLVIYGGPWPETYKSCHRGKVPQADLHKVYSSAKVNLDFRHPEHALHGTVNQRVYDILACKGNIESDAPIIATHEDILRQHTYAHRVATLMDYLKGIL